jgi:hypothetical protein
MGSYLAKESNMAIDLCEIMLNGFLIYPSNGKFILKKEATSESFFTLDVMEFSSYGDAIEYASEIILKPKLNNWYAIVRYNQGLGVEYKKINDIFAENHESAVEIINDTVKKMFKNKKVVISEIKVKLKSL